MIRKLKRRIMYKKAKDRADSTDKKLLIIGDPYNGLSSITFGSDYECGDLCLDLTGCPKCPVSIKGRLEDTIADINLDEYVVFISCVLEYVDDIDYILGYLDQMNKDDLFIVHVEWYAPTAYLYPYYLTGERPPRYIFYDSTKYFKNPIIF